MVIRPDSDCGKARGPEAKTIGRRFKLSEIANMDQTPLAFEINDGRDARRRAKFKKFHPGVAVIFNPKAYTNSEVMKQ
jgi:hypothetical protein